MVFLTYKKMKRRIIKQGHNTLTMTLPSKWVKKYTVNADVLVTAAGVAGLIKREHVKPGAFVIDVGIVKTKTGICGDVDFNSVKDIAGRVTPVPGGVGPVTVACSLQNMVKTFLNCV